MRICLSIALFLLSHLTGLSQQLPDSLFLRVVVPESDTVQVPFVRHRIAACTNPGATAFINDSETKVYASGAFVGLVPLTPGLNSVRLTAKNSSGDSLVRQLTIVRAEPIKSSPREPVIIDTVMMQPIQDLWLGKNDILEVKFKGSPGYEASFDIDGIESRIPMREMPAKESSGIAGIYIGKYKIKDDDASKGFPIKFRLKKGFWSSEKAYSKGKVWIMPDSLPRVGEIVGKRPFLNAGLGTDRLGGAKLGFLQPGVLVQIVGKAGQQFKVHLSESMDGWLPEEFVRVLPFDTPLPRSLTSSISVRGDDSIDVVTVPLSQRLPYISDQLVNPNAVTVDIFGATSNTNWITQHLSAKGIESVKWNQVASEQFRLTITLKGRQQWGYDIGYDTGGALRIKIRRPPLFISNDSVLAGMTIAIDPGHGGESKGALGATGTMEKDVTLNIVRHLQDALLHRGAKVIMTRTVDDAVGTADRIERTVSSGARILVSVHCNSIGENSDPLLVQGTSTYYRYIGFKPLATIMYDKMLELGLTQFGVTGSFNFALNAPTQLPNVLVETAFLSNPEDEMLLIDDGFRTRIAEQIAKGLEEFLRTYAGNGS
jgi:N-acetylmuramoyl-L-alanine amidase